MTPEQWAVKWFEEGSMQMIFHLTRGLLYAKDRIAMALVFMSFYFYLSWLLVYVLTDGSFVFTTTDTLNSIQDLVEELRPREWLSRVLLW